MQMKLKLAATASTLALAASLGLTFAGPATAQDTGGNLMCAGTDSNLCAYANSGESPPPVVSAATSTVWNSPRSEEGEISKHGSNPAECMELHNNNLIVWDKCQGLASQEWWVAVGSRDGATVYWYQSDYDESLCLNATAHGNQLNATMCNFTDQNQGWYLPAG
jgi:hypothetical protein